MSNDPLTAAFNIGKTIIERVWPNPKDQAEQLLQLAEIKQRGDLAELNAKVQEIGGQLKVNAVEASHKSVFIAGWRPFVGWVGGVSLAYVGVLEPILRFIATMFGYTGDFPIIETGGTITILMGMLGIGGMRSYDKSKGTQTDRIN